MSNIKFEITGFDVNSVALEKASNGIYNWNEIKSLEKHYRDKYFIILPNDMYQIKETIRRRINFTKINMINYDPGSLPH